MKISICLFFVRLFIFMSEAWSTWMKKDWTDQENGNSTQQWDTWDKRRDFALGFFLLFIFFKLLFCALLDSFACSCVCCFVFLFRSYLFGFCCCCYFFLRWLCLLVLFLFDFSLYVNFLTYAYWFSIKNLTLWKFSGILCTDKRSNK